MWEDVKEARPQFFDDGLGFWWKWIDLGWFGYIMEGCGDIYFTERKFQVVHLWYMVVCRQAALKNIYAFLKWVMPFFFFF